MKKNIPEYLINILILLVCLKAYSIVIGISTLSKLMLLLSGFISVILIILKIIKENKINYLYLTILIISLLITALTKNGELTYSLIITYALSYKSFNEYIKLFYKYNLFFFILVIIITLMGLKSNVIFKTQAIQSTRKDLGFDNPNTAYVRFYSLWLCYLYFTYIKNNKNILNILIVLLTPIFMYKQTYTRTGLYTICITLFFMIILYILYKLNKKDIKLLTAIPLIYTFLSLFLCSTWLYNSKIANKIFSSRPWIWHKLINFRNYPINLIGYDNELIKKFSVIHNVKYSLDGSYISMLLKNGIIITILMLAAYSYTIYYNYKKRNFINIILLFSILTYGIMETIITDITVNISLLLMFEALNHLTDRIMLKQREEKNA